MVNVNNKIGIFNLLKYVAIKYGNKQKLILVFSFLVMILAGISEIFSIISVVPFLTIVTDPGRISEIYFAEKLINFLGLNSTNQILIFLALLLILASTFTTFIKLLNIWINGKLAANIACKIAAEGYYRTLHQSYEKHLYSKSSNTIDGYTTQVTRICDSLRDSLQIISSSIVGFSIVLILFIVDFYLAFIATTIIFLFYLFFAYKIRKKLVANSKIAAESSKLIVKNLQESLGGIKDLILGNYQKYYLDLFKKNHKPLREKDMESLYLSQFPKYMFETISIFTIAIFAILLSNYESGSEIIVKLGVFALASQKLIPYFQLTYASWARLKASSKQVQSVLYRANQSVDIPSDIEQSKVKKFELKSKIEIKNLRFSYKESNNILENISFEINKGDRIGLIGSTGSGKSTLIDIIMGLLPPSSGEILIDKKNLYSSENKDFILKWWKSISFVPQNIFLSDRTIAENIAFGINNSEIDFELVEKVAKVSQLNSFLSKTKNGLQTSVGERGLRISGGQMQRLGIARALYNQNKILILDEATSALDTKTEKLLMHSINNLDKDITIVMVTHRLSTLNNCNKIINIKSGRVDFIDDTSKFEYN
tara:strand:- start:1223 stop:3013 length:1791 start_codon:yes stop_codon:yes gene_type:complete